MPQVIHFVTSVDCRGVNYAVADVAQTLHEQGVSSEIWCISRAAPGVTIPTDVPIRCLDLNKNILRIGTARILADMMAADPPRVLHAHSFNPHVHAVRVARHLDIPYVLVSYYDMRLSWHRPLVCRRFAPSIYRAVVENEAMERRYQQCGYTEAQFYRLPLGVDSRSFVPQPPDLALKNELRLPPEAFVYGAVGWLHRIKGHSFLVKALAQVLAQVPQAYLIIVGDGAERRHLEALAARLGVSDRIRLLGFRRDIPRILSLVNIYVHPSLSEGQPFAVTEAMAMGLPIIGSRVGGIPELLEDGRIGRLVPPEDVNALVKAMLELTLDDRTARDLAQSVRAKVERQYTQEHFKARLLELYAPLLDQQLIPPMVQI